MADSITCDWCGHTIDDFSALNNMLCYGLPAIREWHLHLPRDGYECMEQAVNAFDKICDTKRPAAAMSHADRGNWRVEQRVFLERCHAWERIPTTEREHQILNALDDARLCAREIAEKIAASHDWIMRASHVKLTLAKMVDRGDLQRVKQSRKPGSRQFRWLYFRQTRNLPPELVALEQALQIGDA